jgi:hypothetical protein
MLNKELETLLQGVASGRLTVLSLKKHEKRKNTTKYSIVIQDNAVPESRKRGENSKKRIEPKNVQKKSKQPPADKKVVVEMPPSPPKPSMADITSVTT